VFRSSILCQKRYSKGWKKTVQEDQKEKIDEKMYLDVDSLVLHE
jgi:hypothetical protein